MMTTESMKIESVFDRIFDRAMRSQPQIQDILLGSDQGLVVAFKSTVKGKEARLAALAPVLADAGETLFGEVGLSPLGEILLLGNDGTMYLARLKSAPVFLLIAAKGQVNVGLLRMLASEIEAEASDVLRTLLR
ncbi:MAG: hypothetical protein E6K18_05595 [Methanobacteriota archaeon]|nr:MAG: hypothetical protein E6K18_05595 [Euryarchaeota archaeon]